MQKQKITIRPANKTDLPAINRVIEKSVMTWQLPERVKRLALPSYRYDELDLQHFSVIVASDDGHIIGVAAWDTEPCQGPNDTKGLLLHGLYVDPQQQRRGIGRQLLASVEAGAREQQADGLLVKVQKDAEDFFSTQGLHRLAVDDPERDYENRYWKALKKQI
jgi:N-acetylglutamate synthase-like GNAT family acetyltransferase